MTARIGRGRALGAALERARERLGLLAAAVLLILALALLAAVPIGAALLAGWLLSQAACLAVGIAWDGGCWAVGVAAVVALWLLFRE